MRRGECQVSSDEWKETEKNMKRKITVFTLWAMLLAFCSPAQAQQAKNIPRIGYLSRDIHPSDSRAPSPRNLAAFRQGLRDLGYIEGKNIIIEYRYSDGRKDGQPPLRGEYTR